MEKGDKAIPLHSGTLGWESKIPTTGLPPGNQVIIG
jgi:hypothetical protein